MVAFLHFAFTMVGFCIVKSYAVVVFALFCSPPRFPRKPGERERNQPDFGFCEQRRRRARLVHNLCTRGTLISVLLLRSNSPWGIYLLRVSAARTYVGSTIYMLCPSRFRYVADVRRLRVSLRCPPRWLHYSDSGGLSAARVRWQKESPTYMR